MQSVREWALSLPFWGALWHGVPRFKMQII